MTVSCTSRADSTLSNDLPEFCELSDDTPSLQPLPALLTPLEEASFRRFVEHARTLCRSPPESPPPGAGVHCNKEWSFLPHSVRSFDLKQLGVPYSDDPLALVVDTLGIRKGPTPPQRKGRVGKQWCAEEDEILRRHVNAHGPTSWKLLQETHFNDESKHPRTVGQLRHRAYRIRLKQSNFTRGSFLPTTTTATSSRS